MTQNKKTKTSLNQAIFFLSLEGYCLMQQSSFMRACRALRKSVIQLTNIVAHKDFCVNRISTVSPTFFHAFGILASYMLSRASRRFSDMMMLPSMASLRSVSVLRTIVMIRCIRSISCLKKIFTGCRLPIFWRRSLTYRVRFV